MTTIPATADAGLGQRVFKVDRDLGGGYAQRWNFAVQRELAKNMVVEVAYAGSKITHVGIPDTNVNQLTVAQLALGPALLQRIPNPFFGQIPRSSSLGDPTIPLAQLLSSSEQTAARFFNTAPSRSRRSSRLVAARAIRCVVQPIATSTSR